MLKKKPLKMSTWLRWMTELENPLIRITQLQFGGLLVQHQLLNIFIDEKEDGNGGKYLLLYTVHPNFTMTFFGLCLEDFLEESDFANTVLGAFFHATRIITPDDGRTKA